MHHFLPKDNKEEATITSNAGFSHHSPAKVLKYPYRKHLNTKLAEFHSSVIADLESLKQLIVMYTVVICN